MADNKESLANKGDEKATFSQFIWNSRTKEFFGRTGTSWAKILLFYVIFYMCLAAFWAVMLIIFSATIDDKQPKWQLTESKIGTNPGLGFRPRPPKEKIDSTLIRFRQNNERSYSHWVEDLKTFLDYYTFANENKQGGGADGASDNCERDGNPASKDQFCPFTYDRLITQNCVYGKKFGYMEGTPCVLIKLNKIFGWEPDCFDSSDKDNENLPEILRTAIVNVKSNSTKYKYIYVTCEGQNAADKENIGEIEYYPQQGIKSYYFPYKNQDNYRSPFVFVRFQKPTPGILINVECKAWAKNIKHDLVEREGSVHFEIAID